MALSHLAQLVCQHRGQLVTRGHHANQAQVHTQVATGQRKGIHRAIAPQQHLPGKALIQLGRELAARARSRQQRLPQPLHIFHQHRVIDVVRVAVQLADDAVAQPALFARGEGTAIAQGGQAGLGSSGQRGTHTHCYQ